MSTFNLRDWAVGQKILADDLQGHTDRHNAVYPLSFSGNVYARGGFKHGMAVYIPPSPPQTGRNWRWGKILTPSVESPNKWFYAWSWQRETDVGWEDDDDASDPVDNALRAYNSMEANNSSSGVQGNGVNVDTLPAGFDLQPIAEGAVVQIWLGTDQDGVATFRFSSPNAVDGECPE